VMVWIAVGKSAAEKKYSMAVAMSSRDCSRALGVISGADLL